MLFKKVHTCPPTCEVGEEGSCCPAASVLTHHEDVPDFIASLVAESRYIVSEAGCVEDRVPRRRVKSSQSIWLAKRKEQMGPTLPKLQKDSRLLP